MNFKHFTSDLLAGRFALMAEGLDFTINYDIKYRLGLETEEGS